MSTFLEERTLDLTKDRGETRRVKPVRLRQDEEGLTEIVAHITDDGEPFDLSDCSVRFAYINTYGGKFFREATVTDAAAGVVSYTVEHDLTRESGTVNVAYFEISTPDGDVTTDKLPIIILPSADLSDEEVKRYMNDLDKLKEQFQGVVDDIYYQLEEIITAEAERIENENTRIANEDQRIDSENTRIENENQREENEDERKSAEDARRENEDERIANEDARVTAEQARSVEFVRLRGASETATQNANAAAAAATATNNTVIQAEKQRVANEQERVEYYENIQERVRNGEFDGQRGSLWYVGTAVNKAGGDVDGSLDHDMYLNSETADVFTKTDGLWIYHLTLGSSGGGDIEVHLQVAVKITSEPANGTAYMAGEKVKFEISMVNDSIITVYDLETKLSPGMFDDNNSNTITVDEIRPGSTYTLTATYNVTEDSYSKEIKLNVISGNALVQANAYSPLVPVPARNVKMTAAKTITSTGTGDDGEYFVGDTVTFDVDISNAGNITLHNVTVTEQLSGCTIINGDGYTVDANKAKITAITPGASAKVKAQYVVPEADQGRAGIINSARIEATETTATATAPAFNVSDLVMTLEMVKNITSTGTGTGGAYTSGDTVKYAIVVTNTGTREYDNVTVTEKLANCTFTDGAGYTASGQTATIAHIGAMGSVTLNAQRVIAESDLGTYGFTNTAQLTHGASKVDATSDAIAVEAVSRTIGVTVSMSGTPSGPNGAYLPGDTITYTAHVTNTGNVKLDTIEVTPSLV